MNLQHIRCPRRVNSTKLSFTLTIVFAILLALPSIASAGDLSSKLATCAQNAQTQNIPPQSWMDGNPEYDQIIIDFKDELSNDEARKIGAQWGLDLQLNSKYSDQPNIFVANVPEGAVPAFQECLKDNDAIEGIEENFRVKAFSVPNDPLYPFQWNFQQVNSEGAWLNSTGKGVVVAVIDTGVALDSDEERHIKAVKDLQLTGAVPGYDFVDNDDFAWDGHGHGTHVAGTIAQSTNNAYGVAGLAYDADIMPLRVLNNEGYGSVSDIADAIRFAADNGAHVINMSLGGPLPSLVMSRAVKYAHKKGVTIVAAAGNSGRRELSYPAAYKNVIAVAATQFDRSTTFYSQWGDFVDIAAPGGNTRVDQNNDGRPDGIMQETLKDSRTDQHEFALYMGTSMASPHVAAVAALIIAQGVTNPKKVEEILLNTASNSERDRFSSEKEYRERYGAGIVQADAAVQKATQTPGTLRLGLGLLFSLLLFAATKQRNFHSNSNKPNALFFSGLILASSGLFFLPPLLAPFVSSNYTLIQTAANPISHWGAVLLGPSYHLNPILASFLLPLVAMIFLGISSRWKQLCAGLAVGMAAFCFVDAVMLYSDVQWIPGTGFLDRTWLFFNGLLSLGLAWITLKQQP